MCIKHNSRVKRKRKLKIALIFIYNNSMKFEKWGEDVLKINTKELLSEGLSGFTLKMIAITAMFIDHVSYLGVPSGSDFEWIIRFIGL